MILKHRLTFATANLFNFVKPPAAFYHFSNIYDEEGWQQKCDWIKAQLRCLNADILGLQEVFSIDAARTLFAESGYPYFSCLDSPHVEQDYIYSHPVVAVASRYPISHAELLSSKALNSVAQHYNLTLPEFSRAPMYVVIEVPEIGSVGVYVCHLKSQRPMEGLAPSTDINLVGRWLSSQQRAWEAIMLRLLIEQNYRDKPFPVVLMGDMNQSLTSDISGLLVQKSGSEEEDNPLLKDSWTLWCQWQGEGERSPSHYHQAKGTTLDYLLLSPEFQSDSMYCCADIVDYHVLDQHLINPIFERDHYASDHAFIAVTVEFSI